MHNAWRILSVAALSFWLWDQNRIGTGAVAASIAMALRLTGMSLWLMWEAAALFEDIGTMRDGLGMLAQPPVVQDRQDVHGPGAQPGCAVPDSGRRPDDLDRCAGTLQFDLNLAPQPPGQTGPME